jgi:Mg2+-importing ATPase
MALARDSTSARLAAAAGNPIDTGAEVVEDAASVVLHSHDLDVLHGSSVECRRAVENARTYILISSGSNLGNMHAMAGGALFLPLLPMLPT